LSNVLAIKAALSRRDNVVTAPAAIDPLSALPPVLAILFHQENHSLRIILGNFIAAILAREKYSILRFCQSIPLTLACLRLTSLVEYF
jgi:hypothetical protein